MPENKAFVGVSLDSRTLNRSWLRQALRFILDRHRELLFLIADDLYLYNFCGDAEAGQPLDLPGAERRTHDKGGEFTRFVHSEVAKLPPSDQGKVQIQAWSRYSDSVYVHLLRKLNIAYGMLSPFRQALDKTARAYLRHLVHDRRGERNAENSIRFLLDEMAMCLRVTEVEGYCHEYYPVEELKVLTDLYQGAFQPLGLEVSSLLNRQPRRMFRRLTF